MLARRCSDRSSPSLLVGTQSGAGASGAVWRCSGAEHSRTVRSSSHAPWYSPSELQTCDHTKPLPTGGYCSFVHNCPQMAASEMSSSRRMDKPSVSQPDNGGLSSNEINEPSEHGGSVNAYGEVREANLKGCTPQGSVDATFWKGLCEQHNQTKS